MRGASVSRRPTENARPFAPSTRAGWTPVALLLGLIVAIVAVFVLSDRYTNGGSTMAPIWFRFVIIGVVLLFAVPAVVTGLKARRDDPSLLGTAALVTAGVVGSWIAFTGVLQMFFE